MNGRKCFRLIFELIKNERGIGIAFQIAPTTLNDDDFIPVLHYHPYYNNNTNIKMMNAMPRMHNIKSLLSVHSLLLLLPVRVLSSAYLEV